MDDQIRDLACARATVGELEDEARKVAGLLADSPLGIQHAQLQKRLADMQIGCDELEAQIRRMAWSNYEETGHYRPHPAVWVFEASALGAGGLPSIGIDGDLSAYLNREEE